MRIEVHQRGAPPARFESDRLELRFAPGNRWDEATWQVGGTHFAASLVEGIAADGIVSVMISEDGRSPALLERAHGVLCDYPAGALCFAFAIAADGTWVGHTVARAFRKLAVAPFAFDPA